MNSELLEDIRRLIARPYTDLATKELLQAHITRSELIEGLFKLMRHSKSNNAVQIVLERLAWAVETGRENDLPDLIAMDFRLAVGWD